MSYWSLAWSTIKEILMAFAFFAVAAVAAAQAAALQPLSVSCVGGGTARQLRSTSIEGSTHLSGNIGTANLDADADSDETVLGWHDHGFSDQVDVRLFAGDDRIRMPRAVLPPIHGGNDGWFKLRHVVADARSIRGTAAVSLLNSAKVFIDRVTGTISISGPTGDYSGQCRAVSEDAPAKF
jgi:hypothetical protein